ncbi:5'-methylthioadenosine/S-adenosylhomocysteine nucleosidase [Alkalihalobacillus alcalophilus ATCC 27647 = CGMCC 1.3604]|uniref:5'-methylthioadenosine/S-adenosylhomocysteine nucleosidase n=1 Tax=Alkalihalobacillus alcalophilus ATCC 27647 = CGMCC 1.3604 TaxID=1218173 RepID=A0A094WPP9_ALKAL|nr:5'-methylthioadenosine/S-adenosylhomocysteine nucleosidase [Alkalihalobacillus alcalophilus]KGA98008.1 5'-methylthioadenosine nucleosidase [Alkalihalobacillus alcalophilus ATCC 27647 = CGMCC 1.3604]MED1561869.1 5'-methylthioadenosine/S-adenosylhomocysteine nucleosidase [Alkalihalobacillus alcalophilus]THG90358.1 5'-methylthioadenosine/S-adenosylhomocysteine nucleosidase [Alkalihalobacillus alcalophilus ATCC 27647 = CGMCC 1.3604]
MTIGIIGAMEEEVELLKSKIDNRVDTTIAGCEFHQGTMNGKEVVLLKSGIGKVNAAVGTTLLIQLFKPKAIINTGSAGGFNESLKVGDIVISTEVRYNDVDATVFGYEFGQVPQMPAYYQPAQELVTLATEAAKKVGVPSVPGLILSGDSFMSDHNRVLELKEIFNEPACAEMEAGAIAQVCHQFGTPFVIIRSLSDIAGQEAKLSYEQFLEKASVHSAKQVLLMIESI